MVKYIMWLKIKGDKNNGRKWNWFKTNPIRLLEQKTTNNINNINN